MKPGKHLLIAFALCAVVMLHEVHVALNGRQFVERHLFDDIGNDKQQRGVSREAEGGKQKTTPAIECRATVEHQWLLLAFAPDTRCGTGQTVKGKGMMHHCFLGVMM